MKQLTVHIILFIGFLNFASAQITIDSLVIASIETETNENGTMMIPLVQNKSELHQEYNYLFLVKKLDSYKNISLQKQSGKFTLTPKELKKLSTIHVNDSKKNNIKAILYIRDETKNVLIAADSLELNSNDLSAPVKETSLMIQGIVVDDTKTKIGKDFYDYFYSTYHQIPTKYNFIVSVSEMPHRGQTTIIQIKTDNDIVYEFIGKPDEEYIKAQVAQTLRILQKTADNQTYTEFKY